jgi:drug/metabolite transporter (DMT)-like permease
VKVEVSMAYPFVGLGFIVTMILGKYIMGDTITATRVVGALLISIGVVLVSLK